MKTLRWLLIPALALGCGGAPFTTSDSTLDGGGGVPEAAIVDPDSGSGLLDQRTVVREAGPEAGDGVSVPDGADASAEAEVGARDGSPGSSGDSSSGTDAGPKLCCHFQNGTVMPWMQCSPLPWLCTGAQTYSCAQPGQCVVGLTCYASGGPYGGTVEPCP